jgi:hypothetical protein
VGGGDAVIDVRREVLRLLACQLGALGLVVGGLVAARQLVPGLAWGAWLPIVAWILGASTWVWRLSPDPALTDRAVVRALALGSGVRTGLLAGGVWLVVALVAPGALGPPLPAGLALAALVGLSGVAFGTALTLVGLDLGRSDAAGRAP